MSAMGRKQTSRFSSLSSSRVGFACGELEVECHSTATSGREFILGEELVRFAGRLLDYRPAPAPAEAFEAVVVDGVWKAIIDAKPIRARGAETKGWLIKATERIHPE